MELRTEIELAAPPERVWAVLVKFNQYPRWNPLLTEVIGRPEVGAKLEVRYNFTDGSETHLRVKVIKSRKSEELRWVSHLWFRGLFDLEHFFLLSKSDSGGTRLVQGADASGRMVNRMGHRLTHLVRGFVGMNQALQRYLEE
jgi:hypothetical protein